MLPVEIDLEHQPKHRRDISQRQFLNFETNDLRRFLKNEIKDLRFSH